MLLVWLERNLRPPSPLESLRHRLPLSVPWRDVGTSITPVRTVGTSVTPVPTVDTGTVMTPREPQDRSPGTCPAAHAKDSATETDSLLS